MSTPQTQNTNFPQLNQRPRRPQTNQNQRQFNRPRRNNFGFQRRNFQNNRRGRFRNQFNQRRNLGFRRFNNFGRTSNYRRLYLSNLPPFLRRQELYNLIRPCGRLMRCIIHYNQNGTSRRTAFLQFFYPQDARRALRRFNGYNYRGFNLRVSYRRFGFGFGLRNNNIRFNNNFNRRGGQRRIVFRRDPNRRTAFRRRRQ